MSSQTIFVTKGSVDVTVDVALIQDNSGTNPGDPLTGLNFTSASLTCYYREGGIGAAAQLTLATQTVTGAHSDGGFVEIDATNMPGLYRLDLSDTIVSGANNSATVVLAGFADLAPHTIHIVLTNVDLYDGVRGGMTALPNAAAGAAGGLPTDSAGKTSFNDIAATAIVSAGAITTSGGAVTTVSTLTGHTPQTGDCYPIVNSIGIKKNTAFSNFEFNMVLSSDGRTAATGKTVTGERSIDGLAFEAVSGTIAEVSDGVYQFDALAADTNGDVITWKFSEGTCDDTIITFETRA